MKQRHHFWLLYALFIGVLALNFAPTAITRLAANEHGPPRLVQRVLSLFGPNGALPTHLTEYARERAMHHGDRTFAAFADLLLHRFGLLFYRAWARTRPVVGMDRGGDAPIVRQVGALVGLTEPALRARDALGDFSKLYFAGRLARSARDADGLQSWISLRFKVPALVQQFSGHWMALATEERTRLQRHDGIGLGRGARKAVQHEAINSVIEADTLLNQSDHDVIRNQFSGGHKFFRSPSKFRPSLARRTKHVAGRNLRSGQFRAKPLGLCTLARSGRAEENDVHYAVLRP